MKRFVMSSLPLALWLAATASAQAAAPAPPTGIAPGPGVDQAMIRVVHAAPNAEVERVVLTDTGTGAQHTFQGLEYLQATAYEPLFPGPYTITVDLAPVDDAHDAHVVETQRIDTVTGSYYTVVLMGLVLPGEAVGAEDDFLGWLEELFTAERRDLTLFPMVLDDLTYVVLAPTEAEVRLLHAAPGTDAVDLVFVRPAAPDEVLHTEPYGNVSGYTRIFPAEGSLQIRVAGTEAVVVDLAEIDVHPASVHTVILTGTPVEDVPLRAMMVSSPVLDPITRPTAPGVPTPASRVLPAAEAAWANDRLFRAQMWLEAAEARISATLIPIADVEDQATAALLEVHAARSAIEQIRILLQAFAAPGAPPPTPGVPPDEPEEHEDDAD